MVSIWPTRGKGKLSAALIWLARAWSLTEPWRFIVLISLMALVFAVQYYSSISEVIRMDWYGALFRILTLVVFTGTFAWMFGLLRTEWDFTMRPFSMLATGIVRVGIMKSFRIFFLAFFLSAGVNLLLEPYASYGVTASSLQLGVIGAGCVVLYDLPIPWSTFHDMMSEIILGLAAAVVLVNTFITIPFRFPGLVMIVIAIVATLTDLLLSLAIRYTSKRVTGYMSRRGISWK